MTNDPNPGEDAFSQQSVDTIADLTIDTTNNSNYYIYDQYGDNLLDPVGPIGIIALPGCGPFTARVNNYLYKRRLKYLNKTPDFINTRPGFLRKNYLIDVEFHRQPTGEGKTLIRSSVRGHDLFIIADVLGRNTTYTLFGNEKHMSPDELYQDLKRIILACSGKARRINVIMPFLYESRQHKRNARESLDCAYMLRSWIPWAWPTSSPSTHTIRVSPTPCRHLDLKTFRPPTRSSSHSKTLCLI